MSNRTITLTNRPPVTINEDAWPVIAKATDKEHDGQVECQANRTSEWSVRVRQHDDGRTIVYATYSYDTNWQGRRSYSAKRGVLLPAGASAAESNDDIICRTIREVCADIAQAECDGDDAQRWDTLANECIADLPAEVLE